MDVGLCPTPTYRNTKNRWHPAGSDGKMRRFATDVSSSCRRGANDSWRRSKWMSGTARPTRRLVGRAVPDTHLPKYQESLARLCEIASISSESYDELIPAT